MDFIYSLREHPGTPGDFTDKDDSLRERQIEVIGKHAIAFRADAPVCRAVIVDVRPADK